MARERVAFFKKQFYVNLNFAVSFILLSSAVLDYFDNTLIPLEYRTTLTLLHGITFFLFIASFTNSLEGHKSRGVWISLIAFVMNLVGFALRVTQELWFLDFRPPQYSSKQ